MNETTWALEQAVALCIQIEGICPKYGCHVGLTGGTLYKPGERKDLDIIFYRIRQVERIDLEGLWMALDEIGVVEKSGFGWCHKATYHEKNIDIFFPEETEGDEYRPNGNDSPDADLQVLAELVANDKELFPDAAH